MKRTLNWNRIWTMFIIMMIVFVMAIGFAKREAQKRLESYDNACATMEATNYE